MKQLIERTTGSSYSHVYPVMVETNTKMVLKSIPDSTYMALRPVMAEREQLLEDCHAPSNK